MELDFIDLAKFAKWIPANQYRYLNKKGKVMYIKMCMDYERLNVKKTNTPQQTSNLLELLKLREEYREWLHYQLNESPDPEPQYRTFKEWFLTLYHYDIEDNK